MRLRRMMLGMSQETLGKELGLTFQQVQKYEKGANRIGSSRLYHISKILDVPVQFFFEDLPQEVTGVASDGSGPGFAEGDDTSFVVDFLNTSDGIKLMGAFVKIQNPAVRRSIMELVRTLAGEDPYSEED